MFSPVGQTRGKNFFFSQESSDFKAIMRNETKKEQGIQKTGRLVALDTFVSFSLQ